MFHHIFFKKLLPLLFFLLVFTQEQNAQQLEKKSYHAHRIKQIPEIDGVTDDPIWQKLPVATHFVMVDPIPGTPAGNEYRTEVRMAYDDAAIYIAAELYDPQPDQILRQFSQRDQLFAIPIGQGHYQYLQQ